METRRYSPLVLMFLALSLAVVYAVKFFTDGFDDWYNLIAFILFGVAAAMSFLKNMDLHLGWYIYIAAFVFWIVIQFIGLKFDLNSILGIIPSVLVGLFILFYLLDSEVKNTFSIRFAFQK